MFDINLTHKFKYSHNLRCSTCVTLLTSY